jgi:AcrR family transcriptional regulator
MKSRKALLDSARSLVASKGVKAATIAQIAAQAGVAKGLIFYYFKDKKSVIQAIAEELDADYMASLKERSKGRNALESLHQLIEFHFEFLQEVPEGAQFLYQSIVAAEVAPVLGFYHHLHDRILEILLHGCETGEFTLQDPAELAYMILGSLHGVGRLKLSEFKRDYDAARHLAGFYDRILLGQPPVGRAESLEGHLP